jgi:tetratricopeptide (TPR) repeat protein
MVVFDIKKWTLSAVIALAALNASSDAAAASGFVASTEIDRGDVYTEITIRFNCDVVYAGHDPSGKTDAIRIHLEPTSICRGVPPSMADTQEMYRPQAADDAELRHIEYDGTLPGTKYLRLGFANEVNVLVSGGHNNDVITVRVIHDRSDSAPVASPEVTPGRQVQQPSDKVVRFVINLESSRRYPATADIPVLTIKKDQKLFISEAQIDGQTWYRMRIGYFASAEEASSVLRQMRDQYPTAWIDREGGTVASISSPDLPVSEAATAAAVTTSAVVTTGTSGDLMLDARRAMTLGEISRAIQIYTKVLQQPANENQREAQEFLALARERNGQIAHAKAEYERYLAVYPDGEDADRVRQRLTALLATSSGTSGPAYPAQANQDGKPGNSPWKMRSFLSQHYRRDVNQVNDQDEIVSQSSLYTDVTLDARRRGSRFDFSTRLTGGHRYDLLDEDQSSSGNDFRLSYFYVDLLDTQTRLRGRLGRQTRNTGGVLGRFDGLNLTYSLTERIRFEAVAGEPIFSTSQSDTQSRLFYGVSSNFAPFSENLELGVFYLQQDIDSLTDRQVVGTELRYFGETKSLWGSVNYDTAFSELGSAFLQGSWRLPGRLTISAVLDRRRSPFLSLGNALLGQTDQDFGFLAQSMTESELRQLALDRSASTSSATLGLSRPLSPRLQFNLSANVAVVDAIPAYGVAPAVPESEYGYFSADLVATSLFKEGDVGILGLRYANSDSASIYTINLDSRFPFGRSWRLNPRLRVDFREINSDQSTQWIYTPGLRLQYRMGRRGRIDFEAGKRFSSREMADISLDQESYFVNLGYMLFY